MNAPNECPTLNAVPSATETVPKTSSYPALSFPEKNLCLISLSASVTKININWKTSVCLSWLSSSPQELRGYGTFVKCYDIKTTWRGSLALPGGILDICWYPHGMSYVLILISCLLSLMKSLPQINKYPSKHFGFIRKITFWTVQEQSEEDMNRNPVIKFPIVIIVWDTISLHLLEQSNSQYTSYHIGPLFLGFKELSIYALPGYVTIF